MAKHEITRSARWSRYFICGGLVWILFHAVSCSMYTRREEEIGIIRKYDAEINQVTLKIDSLESTLSPSSETTVLIARDSLVAVRSRLEESRKYWQENAGSEVRRDWESRRPCLEAPNNCPPNKTSQRK